MCVRPFLAGKIISGTDLSAQLLILSTPTNGSSLILTCRPCIRTPDITTIVMATTARIHILYTIPKIALTIGIYIIVFKDMGVRM